MFDDTTPASAQSHDESQTTPASFNPDEIQTASARTRYRDAAMSWLALGALLAAWHMEARMERPPAGSSRMAAVRDNGQRYANQLWLTNATRARSWITRAAPGMARAVVSSSLREDPPDWSSIASVRTARRWLGSR